MMRNARFMRARLRDLAALALLLQGCVTPVPVGEVVQARTLGQGTVSQGTVSQGTVSQGTVSQGSQNAVWGFLYTEWWNSGMRLKDTGVVEGHLVATWDRTESCEPEDLESEPPLDRSCGWRGAGWATCLSGTTVKVGAGGCGLGWSSTDSMIRVCRGDKPCTAAAALAANDDTTAGPGCTASTRPSVSFTCPAALPGTPSKYFVMVSPKLGGSLFSYSIGASGMTLPQTFQTALVDAPCSKCPSQFVGTTLQGRSDASPDPVPYRIASVKVEDARTSFYTLEKLDGTPLCMDGPLPHRRAAIPMPGRWDDAGFHQNTTDTFTLACTAGVIAKCYQLGYRPWDVSDEGVSLREYHQTCTRAARADYCGDGGSHTVDGTTIDLYDRLSHVAPDPQFQHPLEAIWRRDLAIPDERGPVACLAKQRWETIPLDGCGELTPDPRTRSGLGLYCEDEPLAAWLADGDNLLVNESAYIDAGLWRWKRLDGNEYRSTTKLPTTELVAPDPNYQYAPTALPPEPVLIGSVYALTTSEGVRPPHTKKLYTHLNPDTQEYLTTTNATPPSPQYSTVEEGWILSPACETIPGCPTSKALRLYRDNATGDHATDTAPPSESYQEIALLGYLPR
jgi:hypothetical protein